jgi:hypothetical protein
VKPQPRSANGQVYRVPVCPHSGEGPCDHDHHEPVEIGVVPVARVRELERARDSQHAEVLKLRQRLYRPESL